MQRQQVLYLWLAEAALDSRVVAWAFHDGARGEGPLLPDADPPFENGVAALDAGFMLLQVPIVHAPIPGVEYETSYLQYEFVFERRVELP